MDERLLAVRNNLELFVLALVQGGHSTPYELKTKAGLSLGSTVPVLARLEKDVLVKASEPGLRRSRKYSITAKGTKVLTQGWTEQLATHPNDIDSILRIAYLAWLNGDKKACQLLSLICDRKPQSVAELAQLSGRSQPNLTRILNMRLRGRQKAPTALISKLTIEINPYSENDTLRLKQNAKPVIA